MSSSRANENFTMKFDTGGRTGWPLPPSSVFKCKSGKPWINPELFQIATSKTYNHPGMMIVGDISKEEPSSHQLDKFYSTIDEDDEEHVYAEPVEVYGLPLPNTKIKAVEYSNNPEKGIDPGEGEIDFTNNTNKIPSHSLELQRFTNGTTENQHYILIPENDTSQSQKKKKWSPFSKHKTQSWRLFY